MLDIVISFFENVSPDYIALPFMFLKAEGYWDYIPERRGPTTEDLIQRIKQRKAETGQDQIELHPYGDKDIIAMLASAPIETLMQVKDDVRMVREDQKTGILSFFNKKPEDYTGIATARIIALQTDLVPIISGNLSHQPKNDLGQIHEWGLEIEHAMSRFMNTSLERVRQKAFHQQNKSSQPTAELKDILDMQRIGTVRRSFIKMRLNAPFILKTASAETYRKLGMKVMDFDSRMTHALAILSQLEESCKDDIAAGKKRIKGYEDTQNTTSKFYELLETYHDTLDAESGRIRREEAEEFQTGGDPSDKLRAKFRDMSLTAKEDIADRLHALRTSMHVCEIEYGAYQTMIAAEKNSWDSIDHLIRVQIPLFRQQLMQAQNIKAGRVAVQMDGLSAKMQKLSGQKLRDAAADAIINGVCEEIKQASDNLDKIAENEIRAITKAQTLMIEDQKPVALLEHIQPELARLE